MSNNDLISRSALKETLHNEIGNHALSTAIDRVIDNAPTVEGKLSDKQIEEIADLLEMEWGYEGIREDVSRILRGDTKQ